MGRPRKVVRDANKPARSFSDIQRIIEMAQKFYELTGGLSLDLQLRSMDRNAEMFQMQTDACMQYGPESAAAYGPNVSSYEARMSASTYARLNAQREKKMAQCMAWAEEGAEHYAAKAKAETPASGGTDAGLGREASASGRDAATVKSEVSPPVEPSREPLAPMKDGESPQQRGQSPKRGQSPAPEREVVDARQPMPADALTGRIAKVLAGLNCG